MVVGESWAGRFTLVLSLSLRRSTSVSEIVTEFGIPDQSALLWLVSISAIQMASHSHLGIPLAAGNVRLLGFVGGVDTGCPLDLSKRVLACLSSYMELLTPLAYDIISQCCLAAAKNKSIRQRPTDVTSAAR